MAELNITLPGTLYFGSDAVNDAGEIVRKYGERILLLSETALHDVKLLDRVQDILSKAGLDVLVIDDLTPGSVHSTVEEVLGLIKASRSQVVVGMGGMRILSAARKLANLAGPAPGKALPYVELPTLARSTFMYGSWYLDEGSDRRLEIKQGPADLVKAVIVDPMLALTIPAKSTGTHLMDIVLAACEVLVSSRANFYSDALASRALDLVGDIMVPACRNPRDIRYRITAAEAGVLCSASVAAASTLGMGTLLAYCLNSVAKVPKSFIAGVLLPWILDDLMGVRTDRLGQIARRLGAAVQGQSPQWASEQAAAQVRKLAALNGLPGRLRDFDLKQADLLRAAELAGTFPQLQHHPEPVSVDYLVELLKKAF